MFTTFVKLDNSEVMNLFKNQFLLYRWIGLFFMDEIEDASHKFKFGMGME